MHVSNVLERNVEVKEFTAPISHVSMPFPGYFNAPLNIETSVVALDTSHPCRSAIISPAPEKVSCRLTTEEVSHEPKPIPVNVDAPKNVLYRVVTEAVSHWAKPVPAKSSALLNVQYSVVTLVTLQPLRSAFIERAS